MLYKLLLTFESVYEIVQCNNSNESYWGLTISLTLYIYKLMLYKVVLPFESVYKSLNWDHSHENFSSIFSTVLFIFSVFQKQENWIVPEVLIIFGALIGVIWLWISGRFSQISCSAVKLDLVKVTHDYRFNCFLIMNVFSLFNSSIKFY